MSSTRPLQRILAVLPNSLRSTYSPKLFPTRTCTCGMFITPMQPVSATLTRQFTTTRKNRNTDLEDNDTSAATIPRWQQTPSRMIAPFRIRPTPRGGDFVVNDDPKRLDAAYIRLLGPGGDKVLGDEAKWLAVTHKSFDHGRRGFNDRLAFLGRRIVELQASQALIIAPQQADKQWGTDKKGQLVKDQYGRRPYLHPALDGVVSLTDEMESAVLSKERLAQLAVRYDLKTVTRWKPRRADDLKGSGVHAVLMTTLYAIVGAVALECGGERANKLVQERILAPLGLESEAEL